MGFLDLFVGRESTPGDPNPSQLFRNNGDGTFTDIAPASDLAALGFVQGRRLGRLQQRRAAPTSTISVLDGRNRLFRNDGPAPNSESWHFTDVAARAGGRPADPQLRHLVLRLR